MITGIENMTFDEAQQQVVTEFSQLGDIFAQYTYLLELSARLPVMTESEKATAQTVDKCQSQVWVYADNKGLHADSDTLIVRSVLYVMLQLLKGRSPEEVAEKHFTFVQDTELHEAFSDQRMSGFKQIEATMKSLMA